MKVFDNYECEGQMSLFDYIDPPPAEELLPCDSCGYCSQGCCDYPVTPDDYCVLGDKKIPKFSWDTDVNEIHYQLMNLVERHGLAVGDKEWTIWSHVPQYGYRMWIDVEGTKGQFTEAFFEDLQEVVDFAKERKIELSPSMPMFFNDYELEPMYISSTFMDKERRKRR